MLLVVQGEAVEHMRACLVDAYDGDIHALAAVFKDDLVERANRGDVPEVRVSHVYRDLAQRFVELSDEAKKIWPST